MTELLAKILNKADTAWFILGCTSLGLLALASLDQLYQRFSHKWTHEPPLLPYRIPFVGHGLWYGKDRVAVFRHAKQYFPGDMPFSLMLFGNRVYVFTHNREVSVVFRKRHEFPFLPLIEKYSGLGWGISKDGMRLLSRRPDSPSGSSESLFQNAHQFYRKALQKGEQLDSVTLKLLTHLDEILSSFDKSPDLAGTVNLDLWSRTILAVSSTNAMMGPVLLSKHATAIGGPLTFIADALTVDATFFLFVNAVPRFLAPAQYAARDRVLDTLERYFQDREAVEQSAPMIKDREVHLVEGGLSRRDVAAYTFTAYIALIANARNATYWMMRQIFSRPDQLALVREELAPIFNPSSTDAPSSPNSVPPHKITTHPQVEHLLTRCPRLRAFYDETLRLYSALSSNRFVVADTAVGEYILHKGHNVMLPSWAQHHEPAYFAPALSTGVAASPPDVFDPERFLRPLEKGGGADARMVRAFGGGISLCSGRHFAGNEVLSIVASVVWRYDIEFVTGGPNDVRIHKRDLH